MRRLGLGAAFPEEARARVEGRLRQLAARGQWGVASALAGEDRAGCSLPTNTRLTLNRRTSPASACLSIHPEGIKSCGYV
jgi:hypothetical protein